MTTREIEAGIQLANISIQSGRLFERQQLISTLEKEIERLKDNEPDEYYYLDAGIQYVIDLLKGLPE